MSIRTNIALFALIAVASFAQAQKHPLLSSGPMLAWAEMTDTAIWVQTTKPAKVEIRYAPLSGGPMARSKTVQTTDAGDHIATIELNGLETGTKYRYELWINGQQVKRDYPLEFQTQAHWRWITNPPKPPKFTFALGSCAYINDSPKFDRPGTPYGANMEIYTSIHNKRPDFMVWMGDNIYMREMDWLTEAGIRYRWRKDRQLTELQALLGSTHQYATWDDHDYGPNDSDRSYRLKDAALRAFSDYFPSPVRGTPDTKGVFHQFTWVDVDFLMLDDRYHRAPNNWPAGPDKVMFGAGQMQWIKDCLISSRAPFKIIVGATQMMNPMTPFESFGKYPTEQKELMDFIVANRIEGVVFLSGDRHHTELIKRNWPGGAYPFYDYTCSALTAGGSRNPAEENNPDRVPGTWVTQKRNFGTIEVSGEWRNRVLKLNNFDKDGNLLWSHEIKESELKVPR